MRVKNKTRKIGGGPGLIKAVLENNIPEVKAKLSRLVGKSDINSPDENNNTPLMISAQKGFNDMFSTLLTFFPDLFVKNKEGMGVFNFLDEARVDSIINFYSVVVKNEQRRYELRWGILDFLQEIPVNASVVLLFKKMIKVNSEILNNVSTRLSYTIKTKATNCLPNAVCPLISNEKSFRAPIINWVRDSNNVELEDVIYDFILKYNINMEHIYLVIGTTREVVQGRVNKFIEKYTRRGYFTREEHPVTWANIIRECIKYRLNEQIKGLFSAIYVQDFLQQVYTAILPDIKAMTDLNIQDIFFNHAKLKIFTFSDYHIYSIYFNTKYPSEVIRRRAEIISEGRDCNTMVIAGNIVKYLLTDYSQQNLETITFLLRRKRDVFIVGGRINCQYSPHLIIQIARMNSTDALPVELKDMLFNYFIEELNFVKDIDLINGLTSFIHSKNSEQDNKKYIIKIANGINDWKDLKYLLEKINADRNLLYTLDIILENRKFDDYTSLFQLQQEDLESLVFDRILEKNDISRSIEFISIKPEVNTDRFRKIVSSPKITEAIKKALFDRILRMKLNYLIKPMLESGADYRELLKSIDDKTDIDLVKVIFSYFTENNIKEGIVLLRKKQTLLTTDFILSELTKGNIEGIRDIYVDFLDSIKEPAIYQRSVPIFTQIYRLYAEKVESRGAQSNWDAELEYEKELVLLCKDVMSIENLLGLSTNYKKNFNKKFISLIFDDLFLSKSYPDIGGRILNDLFLFRCSTANDSSNWSDRFLSNPKIFIDYTNKESDGMNAMGLTIYSKDVSNELRMVLISKLIEKGININAVDIQGYSFVSNVLSLNNFKHPEERVIRKYCSDEMVKYIVGLPGICLSIKDNTGRLPESYASRQWSTQMYGDIKAIDINKIVWNGVTQNWIKSLVDKHFDPETGRFNDPHNQIYCISCLVNVGFRPSACDHVTGHNCLEVFRQAQREYTVAGGIPPGYNADNLYSGQLECCARCAEKTTAPRCAKGCQGDYQCDCALHQGADAYKYYRLYKIVEKFAELQKTALYQSPQTTRTFNSVWKEVTDFARTFPFDRAASMAFKQGLLSTKKFLPDELLSKFSNKKDTDLYPSGIKGVATPNLRKQADVLENNLYISIDELDTPKMNTQSLDESTHFLKFKHREITPGYPIKEHGDISLENLREYIKGNMYKCPSHGFLAGGSEEHCGAYLYPDELQDLVIGGKLTNQEYIAYRDKFIKDIIEIPADGVSNKYFISPMFDSSDTPVELSSACAGGAGSQAHVAQPRGGRRKHRSRKKYKKRKITYKRY